ncbi:hypothetical protein ACQYE4_000686 [Enterobacter bugandensis]
MSTITRERVANLLQFNSEGSDCQANAEEWEVHEMARIALASLEAEPVAYTEKCEITNMQATGLYLRGFPSNSHGRDIALFAAPPAPENAEPVAWLWSHRKHPSEVTLVRPEDDERAEGAHWSGWSCQALYSEPVTTAYKLPMQPLAIDAHGTLRFKENPIVRKLLDYATEHGYGLNEIALDEFEAEDQMQLAQLIGYSLSGYGTLSYVTDESYDRAAAAAPQQE